MKNLEIKSITIGLLTSLGLLLTVFNYLEFGFALARETAYKSGQGLSPGSRYLHMEIPLVIGIYLIASVITIRNTRSNHLLSLTVVTSISLIILYTTVLGYGLPTPIHTTIERMLIAAIGALTSACSLAVYKKTRAHSNKSTPNQAL